MIETDIFGYKQEEDGTYTVLKNNESFMRGIIDAVEAAKIVEMLLKDSKDPIVGLGECELLCQLAEEASELAKAALKLRRAITRKNPTPISMDECRDQLIEEVADVDLIFKILGLLDGENKEKVLEIERFKKSRWEKRLKQNPS